MDTRTAVEIAVNLMEKHGLYAKGWRFEMDSARRRFGCCWHKEKKITLSGPLTAINDEVEVRDTILHEIAHALAGHDAGHGRIWKAMAAAIGARPERCYSLQTVATLTALWRWACTHCHAEQTVKMRRRPQSSVCMKCFTAHRDEAVANHRSYNISTFDFEWQKVQDVIIPPKGKPAPVVQPAPIAAVVEELTQPAPVTTHHALVASFDAAKAVALYKTGMRVVEIAVAMGYPRGHGQNRVVNALKKAGVYKATPVDFNAAQK